MCYKQCQWRNSLNTKQLLPRQWNRSEWTSILSSSVHLRIIHIAFSLNLRYQLPVITSPNLVYVYIYIYRYMTYMGFQICVSTHGDLRLKMSKQVRSIWKISIHLNSLFIFPSPHENNDYSITFLDQSAPNPPGVPRLTLGVGANVAEGHPFNSLHGEHSRLGQWGSSQRWCLNEKDVFPCLKLKNPI